jgi:hypothetical protein
MLIDNIYNIEEVYKEPSLFILLFVKFIVLLNFITDSVLYFMLIKQNYIERDERTRRLIHILYSLLCNILNPNISPYAYIYTTLKLQPIPSKSNPLYSPSL